MAKIVVTYPLSLARSSGVTCAAVTTMIGIPAVPGCPNVGFYVRELRDPDCHALFRSAVVVAAAVVNPNLPHAPQRPDPAPNDDRGGAAWSATAGAGAIAGILPGVAPAFELGAAGQVHAWGFFAALGYLPST